MPQRCCVAVQHIRPEYDNLKEWRADPCNKYMGRGRVVFIDNCRYPPNDSYFANPYKVGKSYTREEAIDAYRSYIIDKLGNDSRGMERIGSLREKYLGCYCKLSESCHIDVIIEIYYKCKRKGYLH